MQARAHKLHGRCQLTDASPSGTLVDWPVPLS